MNLTELNEKELVSLKGDIDKALENIEKQKKDEARAAAEKAAKKFGFTLNELMGANAGKRSASKQASAPKYRNPDDASQTWAGRGRQPGWVKEALASGKSLADLAI